jgi:hypothetical protein
MISVISIMAPLVCSTVPSLVWSLALFAHYGTERDEKDETAGSDVKCEVTIRTSILKLKNSGRVAHVTELVTGWVTDFCLSISRLKLDVITPSVIRRTQMMKMKPPAIFFAKPPSRWSLSFTFSQGGCCNCCVVVVRLSSSSSSPWRLFEFSLPFC